MVKKLLYFESELDYAIDHVLMNNSLVKGCDRDNTKAIIIKNLNRFFDSNDEIHLFGILIKEFYSEGDTKVLSFYVSATSDMISPNDCVYIER